MKRRNADCGKIRRPIKRNKIAEGMYESNTVLYMKFLILWAVVITADFTFMFRFEFLWPFWLLLRSVHDSYKYKGLAFSVLFVCIAITSDLVCLFFIPVHWLLFAASTYVWVHYVWLTDKGICLPTIILWMLFVYLEAAIRWKDSRHMPHLDLCRPFAAHCIGYTVVTLGFGFKSYVGYRMRQRKQREVAKENEFYMQLLQQALPQDETLDDQQQSNILNGNAISPVTISVAQTLQTNSIAFEHHHHHHNHHNNSSHHNDDKSHTTSSLGQVTTSQTTQTAIQQQQMSNNHQSILNSSNSTSFSRNAQASSKLNISNSTATVLTTSTTSPIASVSTSAAVTTANGHVANNVNGLTSHKSHRRSMDKEKNDVSQVNNPSSLNNNNQKTNVNGSSASFDAYTSSNNNNNNTSKVSNSYLNQLNQLSNHVQKDSKDRENSGNWDSGVSSSSFSSSSSNNSTSSIKDSKTYNGGNNFDSQQSNGHHNTNFCDKKSQPNGNVVQYEVEEIVEPSEKVKGRRNRSKKDTSTASKDNHHNHSGSNSSHNQQQSQSNNNTNHNTNSQQNQQKDSNCSDTSNSCSTTSGTISNVASQIVNKICETCLRLEAEVKKYRNEVNHMKHIENELRQKIDSNNAVKSCLQAKQRENEDLEKRLQDLSNLRQMDLINLQTAERRLNDERRQRQSLESQLNNEKKARKQAEEKATRPECSELCKQRKQQMDAETKQLRRELKVAEEAKQVAEQQGRKYEKDLRMFEAEIRNREAQQGTEVLMSALAAMQDKNSTLEKNLSAETRVKLDLFSALGEAKRQLEIKDSMIRNKDEEVSDLKAKIAQFFAVMPTDSLCLPPCSTTGSSMLRMNDTPPLQGPSSPIMNLGAAHQQIMAAHQISARTGHSVGVSTSNSVNNVQTSGANGQNVSNVVVTQTSSNLDPNATAYTPKNSSLVNGGDA